MPTIEKYFTEPAARATAEFIREAGGNEVFLVGYLNDHLVVESVEVFARGNDTAVPALMQTARPGDVVIHNHPGGELQPSQADLAVASALGNDSIGFYIVNNDVSDLYVVVEPFDVKEATPVDAESLTELFQPEGPLAHTLDQFEFRPAQIEMIRLITRSINEDRIAIVEAGTGVGKTFAYFLPAISHALANKERVVVSTNTINLQEQILHKDLPVLRKVLGQNFRAVLVKGRTNYACLRKLAEARQDLNLFSEEGETAELETILEWARTTKDGSKSDLNIEPSPQVWEKVQSESDTTLRTKCPFYNKCFFYNARRQAATADILVANHHLLFSDLAVRSAAGASENAVLPAYQRIILDEAHNIEDVATNYFGAAMTYLGTRRILNRLYRIKDGQEKGLLTYLRHKLNKLARGVHAEQVTAVQNELQSYSVTHVAKINRLLSEVMESLFDNVRDENETGEVKVRLTPAVLNSPVWQGIGEQARTLVREMRGLAAALTATLLKIDKMGPLFGWSTTAPTVDARAQLQRLERAAAILEHVLLERDHANIRWVEARLGYKNAKIVRLRSAPLEVAPILKAQVFERFNNVVLTSATLTVRGRFDYLKSRLGLDLLEPERTLEASLPAPFDYETQALVAVPLDLPDPRESTFAEEVPDVILESVRISRGRAFVLFTAYGMLYRLYNRLKPEIEALGYNVYRQGEENRHRLLQRFRDDTSSVLFATDSFWEGVDVQGDALQSVIIVKLPFKVPTEPVVQARIEALERSGRNAFLELSVPQAVIKFRQGFGRLIRSKTDRGSIVILDKRVVRMQYGRVFLESLPKCRLVTGSRAQVFQELRHFFARHDE